MYMATQARGPFGPDAKMLLVLLKEPAPAASIGGGGGGGGGGNATALAVGAGSDAALDDAVTVPAVSWRPVYEIGIEPSSSYAFGGGGGTGAGLYSHQWVVSVSTPVGASMALRVGPSAYKLSHLRQLN